MAKKINKDMGAWAFLIGVILSLAAGFMTWTWTPVVLAFLGFVVAFMNIKPKEEQKMLLFSIALLLAGGLSLGFGDAIPILETFITNLGAFFSTVAIGFLIVFGYKTYKK